MKTEPVSLTLDRYDLVSILQTLTRFEEMFGEKPSTLFIRYDIYTTIIQSFLDELNDSCESIKNELMHVDILTDIDDLVKTPRRALVLYNDNHAITLLLQSGRS